MAKKYSMTRREIKNDELKDFSEYISEWFQNHSKSFMTVVTTVLVILAIFMLYNRWENRRIKESSAAFSELAKNYVQALEAPEESLREKVNTTVLAADELIKNYGNFPIARNARMIKGNTYYYEALALDPAKIDNETSAAEFKTRRENAFKNARDAFDQALNSAITKDDKAEARLALAQTQESMAFINNDKQMVSDAIGNYKTVIQLVPGTWASAEAALGLGRMMQAQEGKTQDAITLYDSVAKDRALPAPKVEENSRPPKDAKGKEIPATIVNDLRTRKNISYEALAKKFSALAASEE